ncbi:hypothetical protein BSL78_21100 [Apostichopus japonicus]|uniref:Uncharacterized protein n=1 Tax=Stichopus japonicus TaxID=307972 RepID=A0A2G8K220_STIJA|nr:hypothetical protein BSL78_21100 [Apostichopus japonicus]
MYKSPEIVSDIYLSLFTLNVMLNIILLIMSHNGYQVVCLALWGLITATLCVCLMEFYLRILRNVKEMATKRILDLLLFRLLLQNGVSMYTTWCVIATLINLTIVLVYSLGVSQSAAGVISLSFLIILFLIFVGLDLCHWERYMRYTFTPYLTVIWAMAGAMLNDWSPSSPPAVFSAIVLVIAAVCFVIKIINTVIKARRNPLYTLEESSTDEQND